MFLTFFELYDRYTIYPPLNSSYNILSNEYIFYVIDAQRTFIYSFLHKDTLTKILRTFPCTSCSRTISCKRKIFLAFLYRLRFFKKNICTHLLQRLSDITRSYNMGNPSPCTYALRSKVRICCLQASVSVNP